MYTNRIKFFYIPQIGRLSSVVIALGILLYALVLPVQAQPIDIDSVSAPQLDQLATEISWELTYRGLPSSELNELQILDEAGDFTLEKTETTGIYIAIYLDLWQICDPSLSLQFTEERFNEITGSLLWMVSKPNFKDNWNPTTDRIAVFATDIDSSHNIPRRNSGMQSIKKMIDWQSDLGSFTEEVSQKLRLSTVPAYYNHARLTDLLTTEFFGGGVFPDTEDRKRIILFSDGHDYDLHNRLDAQGNFLEVDGHSQSAQDREYRALEDLFKVAHANSATIHPIYVLSDQSYHGWRYMDKIANRFTTNLIQRETNNRLRDDYQPELEANLTQILENVERTSRVKFSVQKFNSLSPTLTLARRDGSSLAASSILELTQYADPTIIKMQVREAESVVIESTIRGWPKQFPPLAEQDIQLTIYEAGSRNSEERPISIPSNELEFRSDDGAERIIYQTSELPNSPYTVTLTSSTSLLPSKSSTFTRTASPPTFWSRFFNRLRSFLASIFGTAIPNSSSELRNRIRDVLIFAFLLLMLATLLWGIMWLWRKFRELYSSREGTSRTTRSESQSSTTAESETGALLINSPDEQNKQFVGRLLRIYGHNAEPLIELSKEPMYFGAQRVSETTGRFICPCPSTEINALQFYILPYKNRLCIYDEGNGVAEGNNVTDEQSDANGAGSASQYHRTRLNDEDIIQFNSRTNRHERQYLSSGDIISIGENIKYRVSLKEQDAGGLRMARGQNDSMRAQAANLSSDQAVEPRYPSINMAENAPVAPQPSRVPVEDIPSPVYVDVQEPHIQSVPPRSRIIHGANSPDLAQKLDQTLDSPENNSMQDNVFRRFWNRSFEGSLQPMIRSNPSQHLERRESLPSLEGQAAAEISHPESIHADPNHADPTSVAQAESYEQGSERPATVETPTFFRRSLLTKPSTGGGSGFPRQPTHSQPTTVPDGLPQSQSERVGNEQLKGDFIRTKIATIPKRAANQKSVLQRLWNRSTAGVQQAMRDAIPSARVGSSKSQPDAGKDALSETVHLDSISSVSTEGTQTGNQSKEERRPQRIDNPLFRRPVPPQPAEKEVASPNLQPPASQGSTPHGELTQSVPEGVVDGQRQDQVTQSDIATIPKQAAATDSSKPKTQSAARNVGTQEHLASPAIDPPAPRADQPEASGDTTSDSLSSASLTDIVTPSIPRGGARARQPESPATQNERSQQEQPNQDASSQSRVASSPDEVPVMESEQQPQNPTASEPVIEPSLTVETEIAQPETRVEQKPAAEQHPAQTSETLAHKATEQNEAAQQFKSTTEESGGKTDTRTHNETANQEPSRSALANDAVTDAQPNVTNTLRGKDDESTVIRLVPASKQPDDTDFDDADSDIPNVDLPKSRSKSKRKSKPKPRNNRKKRT